MNRSVRLLGGKNKNIDDVLTARIDQSRDVLASENIKTAADQLKTFIRKVFHRRDKSKLAVKPGLHGVIVRRSNVGEMPWLQGANVGVNDLSRCERGGRSAVPGRAPPSKPGNGTDEQNSSGNGKPTPSRNPESGGGSGCGIETGTNFLAERNRSVFVKTAEATSAAIPQLPGQ